MSSESSVSSPLEISRGDSRIVLRQFTLDDVNDIFDLIDGNRDHLSQYGDITASKYPTVEEVGQSIQNPANPNKLRFAIREINGTYMGTINLTPDESDSSRAEIGYYLGSEFTGSGYMGEAVRLLTDYAFQELGYEVLFGKVNRDNSASARVLSGAGYVQAEVDGDQVIYSLTK